MGYRTARDSLNHRPRTDLALPRFLIILLLVVISDSLVARPLGPRAPWMNPVFRPPPEPAYPLDGVTVPSYLLLESIVPESRTARWWINRHQVKRLQASMGQAEFVLLGDSLVHNFEKRGARLWRLYYGRYKPLNLGFNSDMTQHALWRIQNGELDGISPKVVVIMIGTNNGGLRRDPPHATAAGIRSIVEEIRVRLPTTRILLLGIFPRGKLPDHPLRQLNAQVNELLPSLADGDVVHYLDISEQFLDEKGTLQRDIMFDFLHPSVRGYQIWAEAINPTVYRLMRSPPLATE